MVVAAVAVDAGSWELWHLWFICSRMDEKHVLVLFLFSFYLFILPKEQGSSYLVRTEGQEGKGVRGMGQWLREERSVFSYTRFCFVYFCDCDQWTGRIDAYTHDIIVHRPTVRSVIYSWLAGLFQRHDTSLLLLPLWPFLVHKSI